MEREFGEFSSELERTGLSETEEDKVVESPTISISQQQKTSKKSAIFVQKTTIQQQKSPHMVFKSVKQKIKKDVFSSR